MFDIPLRPLKDNLFNPLCRHIPPSITPTDTTLVAFISGLVSCFFACTSHKFLSLIFWTLNRSLDCLDGALARHRKQQSDLGGFLDLLGDFIVYALIPISVGYRNACVGEVRGTEEFLVIALLEASFYINNFVLFYIAALVEKRGAQRLQRQKDEVTSLAMRPALVEGFESGVFFTLMLALPEYVGILSWVMFVGVAFGTGQRVRWLIMALGKTKEG